MEDFMNDFCAWAEACVKVEDKLTGRLVPFVANRPQRRVLAVLEEMRRSGRPIRIIMLKARQWGGSTLIQVYMAWMQLVRHRGWNSVVCAHVKDAAAGIRGMYSRLLREYPEEMKSGKGKEWVLSPYEKSQSVVEVVSRGCRITLATAGAPNSVRGSNYSMAHLSEVAFWGDGDRSVAEEIVRTVCGSVPRVADTMIVMESTADGKGNYFYDEWQRAVEGRSDKRAVFVPWHEIEMYRREVAPGERESVLASLDDYERGLLDSGVELESVAWYHDKRREYPTHEAMMAEFPSTAEEAFAASGSDAPFTEEWLPAVRPTQGRVSEPLLVAVPAHEASRRALLLVDMAQGVHGVRELSVGATLADMCAAAVGRANKLDAPLAVVVSDTPDDAPHAEWFARKASEAGVFVTADEEEREYMVLDRWRLLALVDLYKEMHERGEISESDADSLEGYREFRLGNAQESPGVLARLGALSCLSASPAPIALADLL